MKTKGSAKITEKRSVVDATIKHLEALGPQLPDKRTGENSRYTMSDIVLGAFAVFFLQCPSFLARQQAMEQQRGRSNANALFKMKRTPCDNHIRKMLDPVWGRRTVSGATRFVRTGGLFSRDTSRVTTRTLLWKPAPSRARTRTRNAPSSD